MTLTPLGKLLRKLRIDLGIKLKDMAEGVGVSMAFLSAIELGKRQISEDLLNTVQRYFLNKGLDVAKDLRAAVDQSRNNLSIDLSNLGPNERDLLAAFARRFPSMDEDAKQKIKTLLEE